MVTIIFETKPNNQLLPATSIVVFMLLVRRAEEND